MLILQFPDYSYLSRKQCIYFVPYHYCIDQLDINCKLSLNHQYCMYRDDTLYIFLFYICILHLMKYHVSSVLEQNGPQAAATWRWCSRCCSPSSPPSTAPLTPATVLPAEGTPLVSFERRAARGGCCYLPPPPLATHPTAPGTSLLQQGTCAQTGAVRHPEQPRGRTWARAACSRSGASDEPRVEGNAQSTT